MICLIKCSGKKFNTLCISGSVSINFLTNFNDLQNRLSSFIISMKEGLIQVKVILTCCPHQQGEVTHYPSPFPRSQLSHAALMKHGDEQWRECQEKIQVCFPKKKRRFLNAMNIVCISKQNIL